MNPELWEQAEALFLRCADLPPAERDALLQQACAGNPLLRSTVEDLLRGDRASDGYPDAVGRAARNRIGAETYRQGTRIGAYTIESRIAEGGMGVVYLARRSDSRFEQRVAIKLLASAFATRDLRQRLVAERQILANLSHPHIASLLDGGETEDGVPWLAMEYIDGMPIDEYCDGGRLTIDQRIALFVQICAAVSYAHANLVIHRDLKPSNILVTRDGVPKLLDFGIAKLIASPASPRDMALTMEGARLLTPRHASPEQIRGEPITVVSDVYSLGLLLYDLLCGSFPCNIASSTSAAEIERRILEEEPRAPSSSLADDPCAADVAGSRSTTVPDLRRRLRGDLDTIALKALRKRAADRYATPRELIQDLENAAAHRPILARPATRAYLLSRYWRRHRTAAAGVLATLLALIGGATFATIEYFRASAAERQAVAEAAHANAISEFLVSLFQEAHPDTSAGNERSVREILAIGRERADKELAGSPVTLAKVLETLSGVYKGLADYPQAEELQRRALDLHRAALPADRAGEARLLNDLGDILRIQSQHERAETLILEALDIHESLGEISDAWADALNNLGLVYEEMGRQDEATSRLLAALEMRRRLFEAPHEKIANSLNNLAWHYARGVDLAAAERYALEGVEMRIAVHGEVHPRVAAALMLLSRVYKQQGRWDDAERTARRSVAIARQIFDDGHPDLTFPLYELADVLHARGKLAEARDLFGQIVAWERVSLGPESHDFGMSLKAYSGVLFDLGRYGEAEPMLDEALRIFQALPGGSARGLQATETLLGRLYIATGRLDAAARMLGADRDGLAAGAMLDSRRLALADWFLAMQRPEAAAGVLGQVADSPEALFAKARALRARGEPEAAIPLLDQVLLELHDLWGTPHWQAARARAELGRAYLDTGAVDAGRDALEAARAALAEQLGTAHPEVARLDAELLDLGAAVR